MHTDARHAAPAAAVVTPLPLLALNRFHRLMQREGCSVDVQRMCLDIDYAHRCLADAHTSACDALRRLAMELFTTFDRNAVPGTVH